MAITWVNSLRLPLYITLWVFSFVLLGLTSARLNYTNKGGFYDQIVAELLVCSLFALLFIPFVLRLIHRYLDHPALSHRPDAVEFLSLAILWLLWLVGASVATSMWPDLSYCQGYEPCRVLSAMLGFAWLGWLTISALLVIESIPFIHDARERDRRGRGTF